MFSNSPLVSDGSVIDRLVKEMIEHLQHLELTKCFDGP
jgi:hypothetical protein